MFSLLFTGIFLGPVYSPQEKKNDLPAAAKKELKAFEGRWEFVKGASSREESTDTELDIFIEFKGRQMSVGMGKKKETFDITAIDATTDPKCIDLLEKRKGKPDRTLEGIFKIEKDTLQFAFSVPMDATKQRPSGFEKPTDERTVVMTLKRAKK